MATPGRTKEQVERDLKVAALVAVQARFIDAQTAVNQVRSAMKEAIVELFAVYSAEEYEPALGLLAPGHKLEDIVRVIDQVSASAQIAVESIERASAHIDAHVAALGGQEG